MKKLSYILLAIFFAACGAEPERIEEVTPLVNTKASSLKYAQTEGLNLTKLGIINPTRIIRKDSLYIILTPKSHHRFAVYNLRSGQLKRLVPGGNRTGEGLYFLNMNINGNIVSAFDFGTGQLVEIDLNQYTVAGYSPTFTSLTNGGKNPLGAIRANGMLISTGIYTEGRYCCTSPEEGTDRYSVSYPECTDPTLTDTMKSIYYASNCLALNPSHTRLACANMQTGCLDVCEINGNTLTRVNEVHLNRPGVIFQHKRPHGRDMWHPVAYTKHNIFGFCDLASSEDYIFALYSGRTYQQYRGDVDKGKIIFVFDWSGSHIRTYHLPVTCSSISYDKATNTIYALSHDKKKAEIITLNL